MAADSSELSVESAREQWSLVGPVALVEPVNDFLGYLSDRNYSPRTVRAYAFDLLHFTRWVSAEAVALDDVDTDVLLRYLAACRAALLPHQHGGNVYSIRDGRNTGYAPRTVNRRLAALSALFAFRALRDPGMTSPVPRGRETRQTVGERAGLLGHLARPAPCSRLRVREPRELPRGLDRSEVAGLLDSFRTVRDRAIAGLMLFSGLRSCEVLGLQVTDIDIARGWVRVLGKGAKERRVPVDRDVAALIQTYLLTERPDTDSGALFVVAKGPTRGRPLTPAGLRTVFRYHRARAGVSPPAAKKARHNLRSSSSSK